MELYLEKLKDNGLKVTPKRKAIIELFLKESRSLTPEEVCQVLKKKFQRFGVPGVYRNLELLTDCGILVKIHRFDNNRHYGLCKSQQHAHHHHVVCIRCRKINEINECGLSRLNNKVINGFKILNHFLQLEGLCAQCQTGN